MSRAAIVGFAEYPATRRGTPAPRPSTLEMAAEIGLRAIADAGLTLRDVDGISVAGLNETSMFAPAMLAEYLGIDARLADAPDLGGATPAGMVWRAAAAIEAGKGQAVLCVAVGGPRLPEDPLLPELSRFGSSSYRQGSPQAEFEIPFGHLGQNAPYAMIAQRYAHEHGYDPRALARLVAHQRASANRTPGAIFETAVAEEEDVLASRMIATPLRKLEIVMPVNGGSAVLLSSPNVARRTPHRPVWLAGHAERVQTRSPYYAHDLLAPPIGPAAAEAFAAAGLTAGNMNMAQLYDCYSITVLLALEAAGFCGRGEGMAWVRDHDLRWSGDVPVNTNGGQLGYGQAGAGGGMCHVVEAARQIMRRADGRQVARSDTAFVMGNGGIMSEQVALVLRGD